MAAEESPDSTWWAVVAAERGAVSASDERPASTQPRGGAQRREEDALAWALAETRRLRSGAQRLHRAVDFLDRFSRITAARCEVARRALALADQALVLAAAALSRPNVAEALDRLSRLAAKAEAIARRTREP